jgi:hypothetical protein
VRAAKLCRAACARASGRIKRNIRGFDDNDDELLKTIAYDAYESSEYPYDPLAGGG